MSESMVTIPLYEYNQMREIIKSAEKEQFIFVSNGWGGKRYSSMMKNEAISEIIGKHNIVLASLAALKQATLFDRIFRWKKLTE